MNITDYCDALDIEIQLTYFPNQKGRWSAQFEGIEIKDSKDSPCLKSHYGNGTSPYAAVSDYISKIIGKILVITNYDGDEKVSQYTFLIPELENNVYKHDLINFYQK